MRLKRVTYPLILAVIAIALSGCTKVKPVPDTSLSLAGDRPTLSAQVSQPPSLSATSSPNGEATSASAALSSAADSGATTPIPTSAVSLTGGSNTAASLPTPAPESSTNYATHVVVWGDTLLSIAMLYGVPMNEIAKVNNLEGNVIYIGQKLQVPLPTVPPGAQTYTVQPGDTLSGIAQFLGVELDDLMRANNMSAGFYLQVGQVLIVPSGSVQLVSSSSANSQAVQAAGVVGAVRTHTVQPGDTIWTIAELYEVDPEELSVANALADPNKLEVGQTLIIP